MKLISAVPFFKIVLLFSLGILCADAFPVFSWQFYYLLPLVMLFLFLVWKSLFGNRLIQAFLIDYCLLMAGYCSVPAHLYSSAPTCIQQVYQKGDVLQAWVKEVPLAQEKGIKLELDVRRVFRGDSSFSIRGHVILFMRKEGDTIRDVLSGDQILTNAPLFPIEEPKNPGDFNYAQYLHHKNYYLKGYASSSNFIIKGPDKQPYYRAKNIRSYILGALQQAGFSNEHIGIMGALLIGDKTYITDEINQAYTASGTMHILAVSGMHVAILFFLLDQLFKRILIRKKQDLFRYLLLLGFLWGYAFLTGLSASVLRATLMFSIHLIGKMLDLKSNSYNTVFSSAFLLLALDPMMLYDVGFQLSYMAVLGIMAIHPLIFSKISYFVSDEHQWINQILYGFWAMISVSLAAQIMTLPLTLYYFHQFPNYFLLANLLVIPLSTVILYGGIVFFMLHVVGLKIVNSFLVLMLKHLIDWMNQVHFWIELLPYSTIEYIFFPKFWVLVTYSVLLFLMLFIYFQKHFFFQLFLACLFIFFLVQTIHIFTIRSEKSLIILNTHQHHVLGVFDGFSANYVSTQEVAHPALEKINMQYPNQHLQKKNIQTLFYKGFAQFQDQDIFALHQTTQQYLKILAQNPVDYIWICDTISPYACFNPLQWPKNRHYQPTFLDLITPAFYSRGEHINLSHQVRFILDAGLSKQVRQRWLTFMCRNKYQYYDTQQNGAFLLVHP